MRRQTLDILCCADCRGDLTVDAAETEAEDVISGTLRCECCGSSFPIVRGVPRMVRFEEDRLQMAESWSFQWRQKAEGRLETDTSYGKTEEEEVRDFLKRVGLSPTELPGRTILDAGCGYGRLTRALARRGASAVGVDIASSVEHVDEAGIDLAAVQGDIAALPFKEGVFDVVWSRLAICYAADPEGAFASLARSVKPEGRLFVALPDRSNLAYSVRLRDLLRVSHMLPRRLLLPLSWLLALAMGTIKKLLRKPVTSLRANAFFIFTVLHPFMMTRHTHEEVVGWFKKNGFGDIECSESGHTVSVRGTRRGG